MSTSPAASLKQNARDPLPAILVNTKRTIHHLRPSDTARILDAHVRYPSTQQEPLMTSPAIPWTSQNSKSRPSEDIRKFPSPIPKMSSALHDVDAEPLNLNSDDGNIARLASRMQDSVVIRDRAVQTPRMVDVPKGYAVTYDTKPTDHFRDQREVKVHVKRKRDESIQTKPLREIETKELYGFLAHEVNAAGAVSLPNCQPSDLTNEIHPLLDRARFDDTPDAIYDQLVPGLRLASMFLTQPVCMQFWASLALAERKDDQEMSLKYGKRCQRIDKHVELTDENIATITKRLKDMGNANLIHFAFRHKTAMPHAEIWGCSWPIRDYRGAVGRDLTRSLIRLHADYYIVAEKLSQLKYPEQSQSLRFSFIFAVIVLHELAHSIEGAYIKRRHDQWQDLQRTRQYLEPFFMDWQRPPECGRTLEHTMFGGEIHPINKKVDGSHGVCISDWPPQGSAGDSKRRVWYTVPMDYIQELFRTETWQNRGHLRDWKTFHIPRTGATSLYIFSFTTMLRSEEQRVATEETKAELLAIARAQPPTKKRLIATGHEEEQRRDEQTAIESVIGKDEAAKVEHHLSRSRRHSSFMPNAHSAFPQNFGKSRRSRSIGTKPDSPLPSSDEEHLEAVADNLLRRFLETYDSLPARRDSDKKGKTKPTSELVKKIKKKAAETARKAVPHSVFFPPKAKEVDGLKEEGVETETEGEDRIDFETSVQSLSENQHGT